MHTVSLNRRQFLDCLGRGSLLAGALPLAAHWDRGSPGIVPPRIEIPGARPLLESARIQEYFRMGTASFWAAGHFLNAFARQSASYLDYDRLDAAWHRKYQAAGGEPKAYLEARALWEKVPAAIRARGPAALQRFHQGKDWSHIIPRAMGGPTTAENGLWWSSQRNQRLGPRPMSQVQIALARSVLAYEGTAAALALSLRPMLTGGAVGLALGTLLAVMDYGLQYAEGEISREEMLWGVITSAVATGAGSLLVTGLITGIAIAFPGALPVLLAVSLPLSAVGLVYLSIHGQELGEDWWRYLQARNIHEEFRQSVAMTAAASSRAAVVNWERFMTYVEEAQTGIGRSRPWLLRAPFRFVAAMDYGAYLPAIDLARYLPDLNVDARWGQLDIPAWDSLPLPDFRRGANAAHEVLQSAAAYLDGDGP